MTFLYTPSVQHEFMFISREGSNKLETFQQKGFHLGSTSSLEGFFFQYSIRIVLQTHTLCLYMSPVKPQSLFFLFILEKTKYLKVGHNMEPSRCKTTSTVTLACKFRPRQQATSKVIGEHNIPNTVYDLQKKRQNPNIQPYKIIQHTSTSLLYTL